MSQTPQGPDASPRTQADDAAPPSANPDPLATEPAVRTVTSSGTGSVTDLDDAPTPPRYVELTATAGVRRTPAPASDPSKRPPLPRFVAVTLGLAAVVIILLFVRGIQDIVAPIFLGLNLVIVVFPLQRALARAVPKALASLVALIVVLAVLVAFLWSVVWSVVELVNVLPQYNAEFSRMWKSVTDFGLQLGLDQNTVNNVVGGIKPNDVMGLILPLLSKGQAFASLMTTLIVALFFLTMDSSSMVDRLKLLRVVQPRALAVVSDFSMGVRRYWLVTTVFGLIVAALDAVALSFLHVPLAIVWGVLAFITNYIPNIGFVIGVVPPALLALLDGGWVQSVIVLVVYCLLNFVIQVIIQPKFTGESVGITATMSFLSLLFWVFILGPLGALLALPATLLTKAFLIDSDPNARWLNLFVASSPESALPDDEQPAPRNPRKARKEGERRALLRG